MQDEPRVRVLVVDDQPDLRSLIQTVLELDGRYCVVGLAGDGIEGVELAGSLQPDVVVLDRSMPRLGGLEALPRIREVAPAAAVVLYSAESDDQLHQAAVAGGALGAIQKDQHIVELPVVLGDALVQEWEAETDLTVRVGPVPSDAVLEWVANTARILDVVRRNPELLERPVDHDHFDTFCRYLETWEQVARANPEFVWAAKASADDVEDLLETWVAIDRIDESRLQALGLAWSAPNARRFFTALSEAVIAALERRDARSSLTARLREQFRA